MAYVKRASRDPSRTNSVVKLASGTGRIATRGVPWNPWNPPGSAPDVLAEGCSISLSLLRSALQHLKVRCFLHISLTCLPNILPSGAGGGGKGAGHPGKKILQKGRKKLASRDLVLFVWGGTIKIHVAQETSVLNKLAHIAID